MTSRMAGLLLAIAAASGPAAAVQAQQVRIDAGTVEGAPFGADRRVMAFEGIPYAASPAGPSRWKPPQPVVPWTGVRRAQALGPVCPQSDRWTVIRRRITTALGGDSAWVPPIGPTSEDCLSVNVFTTNLGGAAPRPVMVWLHGGANALGNGADEAAALAPYGAVVVTLNYRLGLLGFLAHPALTKESPHGSSGNYGLLDQIEALRWVRRNIAAFGGDPTRVTVFGHSAGGDAVSQLLASPLARGLFHRAVIQSGGLGESRPHAAVEAEGVAIAAKLGAPPGDPLPALRAVPVERLLTASEGPFDVVADGWVLPTTAPGALTSGADHTVPLLIGATADEATSLALSNPRMPKTLEAYRALVAALDPTRKERLLAVYRASSDTELYVAAIRYVTDRYFVCPAHYLAARRRGPTWQYLFTAPPTPGPAGMRMGAYHGSDIRLLFNQTYGVSQGPIGQRVGDAMRRYWVRFAATGDPNAPGLPQWPAYAAATHRQLELGESIHAVPVVGGEGCGVFEGMWNESYGTSGSGLTSR